MKGFCFFVTKEMARKNFGPLNGPTDESPEDAVIAGTIWAYWLHDTGRASKASGVVADVKLFYRKMKHPEESATISISNIISPTESASLPVSSNRLIIAVSPQKESHVHQPPKITVAPTLVVMHHNAESTTPAACSWKTDSMSAIHLESPVTVALEEDIETSRQLFEVTPVVEVTPKEVVEDRAQVTPNVEIVEQIVEEIVAQATPIEVVPDCPLETVLREDERALGCEELLDSPVPKKIARTEAISSEVRPTKKTPSKVKTAPPVASRKAKILPSPAQKSSAKKAAPAPQITQMEFVTPKPRRRRAAQDTTSSSE